MGGALVRAVAKTGCYKLLITDLFEEKLKELSAQTGVEISDTETIAAECDYIFIGVKPQMLEDCFAEIRDILSQRKNCIIVSMAAGVAISRIKELSGIDSVIRIMPNMPVSVGSGVVLGASENVEKGSRTVFMNIMAYVGVFDWIDEKLIDAASALSGCGPAFVYMFIEALADGAVACGLPRDKALLYAAGTLRGSAEMVIETKKHPGKLKDEVCSPGGTTIMGVKALEDGGFRSNAMNAVFEAYKKTKELG